jgi:hypothetical protein
MPVGMIFDLGQTYSACAYRDAIATDNRGGFEPIAAKPTCRGYRRANDAVALFLRAIRGDFLLCRNEK